MSPAGQQQCDEIVANALQFLQDGQFRMPWKFMTPLNEIIAKVRASGLDSLSVSEAFFLGMAFSTQSVREAMIRLKEAVVSL